MKKTHEMIIEKSESFSAGFNAVRWGYIKTALSPREVQEKFPEYKTIPFIEGMIDALLREWRGRDEN